MSSNFPSALDTDASLPRVDGNITEIGPEAINALRDAMFAVEANIGTNADGTAGSVSQRLSISLNPDGSIRPSALLGLGLVTLPITDAQISSTAGIQESKLNLIYSTTSLFNLFTTLKGSVDVLNGFLSLVGVQVSPHIEGSNYNHLLSHIHVDTLPSFVKTLPVVGVQAAGTSVVNRDATNAETLLQDINTDLVVHEKADGTANVSAAAGGTVPPANYAHNASGIFVNPSTFTSIPQANNDLQKVVDYIDNSSLLLLGSRTQNLFANGIPRTSHSSSFVADGYGESIVPPTPITAYLLNQPPGPIAASPIDDFNHGDDVILFQPSAAQLSTNLFDAQFAQVQVGDLLTVNYGNGVSFQFIVDSIKSVVVGSVRTYAVRINGKNAFTSTNGFARIDRSTFHRNKFAVLSSGIAPNNVTGAYNSLIVVNPRSALALGNGFNPSSFDSSHYNLYLTLLPTGNVDATMIQLPAIDLTGNQGKTPGEYTLDSIISATNAAFRQPGFNFRFIAFQYNGQFGIALADPYNGACFSIISGNVDGYGNYTGTSLASFPNNAVDNFAGIDPTGFGAIGANLASPPPAVSFSSILAAKNAPPLIFTPLRRNFFYVNGVERDTLRSDPLVLDNSLDGNGDGYWTAKINTVNILPTRVQVVYRVNLDLSTSGLKKGKTIVVQPALLTAGSTEQVNYGRFIIEDVSLNNCNTPAAFTNITVYDAVHGTGTSPFATLAVNAIVHLYFSDDSISFDAENVFDTTTSGPYKRFFETYTDQNGHTFTHERARFLIPGGSDIANINLYRVSPKLRGYITNNDREIRLTLTDYNAITGLYDGYLARFSSPSTISNLGPITTGKKGEIVRFYDETNIDFIDFIFNPTDSVSSFSTSKFIDIQLFKSLQLNQTVMLLSSCQVNDSTRAITYLKDERQFGNISEEHLTSSAIDFITAPNRLLNENSILRGLDIVSVPTGMTPFAPTVVYDGGTAIINGKIVQVNNGSFDLPVVQEVANGNDINTIKWFVCVNERAEIELVASTDFDPALSATYGSLDHNRLFTVQNPNLASPTPYPVRASFLSDIVQNRKDIVVFATITATISAIGPLSSFVISAATPNDARRFAYNGYGGLAEPFVFGANASFRSFTSLNTWINELTAFISAASTNSNAIGLKVLVKGNTNLTAPVNLNYSQEVIFDGDGGKFTINNNTGFSIGNNIKFRNIHFDYIFDPTSDSDFSASNLVNSKHAAIYGNTTGTKNISNVSVENCLFTSSTSNRYPFISFEMNSDTGLNTLQNVKIRDNRFVSTAANDIRAAIAIISTSNVPFTAILPNLVDTIIDNNICNYNQMIILTGTRNGSNLMDGPLPACNGVQITNNVCGTIAFLTGAQFPNATTVNSNNIIRDKEDQLTIANNTCKLITNLDSNGAYVPFRGTSFPTTANTTNYVTALTGAVMIKQNTASWIQVGSSSGNFSGGHFTTGYPLDGCSIVDNAVYGNVASFLSNFTDPISGITPANVGILLRRDSDNSLFTSNRISGNRISSKNYIDTGVAEYYAAGIVCFGNASITDNILNGCVGGVTGPTSPMVFIHSSPNVVMTGNIINRLGNDTQAYVLGPYASTTIASGSNGASLPQGTINVASTVGFSLVNYSGTILVTTTAGPQLVTYTGTTGTSFTGCTGGSGTMSTGNAVSTPPATNKVLISNNIFDSQFIDAGNSNENTGVGIPASWVFEQNKNQTKYQVLSLTDGLMGFNTQTSGTDAEYFDDGNFSIIPVRLAGSPSVPVFQRGAASYIEMIDIVSGGSPTAIDRVFFKTINLNVSLPSNVMILNASVGFSNYDQSSGSISLNTGSADNNEVVLTLVSYKDNLTSNSSNGILDVRSNVNGIIDADLSENYELAAYTQVAASSSGPTTTSGSNFSFTVTQITQSTAQGSTTQYVSIPVSNSVQPFFTTGQDFRVAATLQARYKRTNAGTGEYHIVLSPVLIKYRW